jgi:hypothetical protein
MQTKGAGVTACRANIRHCVSGCVACSSCCSMRLSPSRDEVVLSTCMGGRAFAAAEKESVIVAAQ